MKVRFKELPAFDLDIIEDPGTKRPGIKLSFEIGLDNHDGWGWKYSIGFRGFFRKSLELAIKGIEDYSMCGPYDPKDETSCTLWKDYTARVEIAVFYVLKNAKKKKWIKKVYKRRKR